MKIYENTQEIKTPIIICLYTAQRWLRKLGYEYKDLRKDMFTNGHERSNIVKDCKKILKKIEKLKLYMIEFKKDSAMKAKTYFSDYTVRRPN